MISTTRPGWSVRWPRPWPPVVDALEEGTLPASACTALQRESLERHADAEIAARAHAQFAKLVAILAPNAQIAAGYTTYMLLTIGGQVFTGLLSADTASSVTLKAQEGRTQTVLRRDIDELRASPMSLMPESLAKALQPQDVADILAWLRDPEGR